MKPPQPQRLTLSRRKGYNLQAASLALNGLPAVNCARPGRWGNPHKVNKPTGDPIDLMDAQQGVCFSAESAVKKYSRGLSSWDKREIKTHLRGKNLACWCRQDAEHCHAKILLAIANQP